MAVLDTPSALDVSALVTQLRMLEQLTQTEAQIARIRIPQARTDAVRGELRENSENAVRRGHRIAEALRALNSVPDVVTPALGRLLAVIKSTVEQAQPLDEALLGDLALEHQLRDRARYVRVLAQHVDRSDIEELADDLIEAHTETVDWLTSVLAEEATDDPTVLAPTALQRVAGSITRVAGLPARFAVERVNRALDTMVHGTESARDTMQDIAGKAARFGSDAREVVVAGRDAGLERAERVARREGAATVADAAHATRTELGSLKAAELPIPHYEEMTAPGSITAIRELDDPNQLEAIIAFEENHKNRSGVLSAAHARLDALRHSKTR